MARRAMGEETTGITAVEVFLPDLKEHVERRRRRRQYWDLTGEGAHLDAAERSTRAPSLASSVQPDRSTETAEEPQDTNDD